MVITEKSDRIGFIILNRPEKRNALSAEMVKLLKEAFTSHFKDPEVKVIILKANGDTFCAGADLAYLEALQQFSFEENLQDSQNLRELFQMIYEGPKLVIAQVEGAAIAGGAGLAGICDYVFAVPEMKLAYTEVKIGFIPALVSVFLTRKIGEGRARELLLTGNLISAQKSLEWGLINEIVESGKIEKEVLEFAKKVCSSNSASSITLTKNLISQLNGKSLDQALDLAAEQNAKARESEDCKKGIAAFLNKEKISW